MANRIPAQFIEDLISRTDIVELIGQYVPLKRSGREYSACCPFHDEKTPSFTVSQNKQFYHCFGCGEHGSALGFLMNYENLPFRDAVAELASRAGVPMPEDIQDNAEPDRSGLYQLMEKVSDYYRQTLRQSPTAIDYLKARGLSGKIALEYGLGYAQSGWDTLKKNFPKVPVSDLLTVGLLIKKDDQNDHTYDRFRERIMFPIRDYRGRVIGFGGRVIGEDSPKYLNSPETPLYHKGRELYGLYEARQALRQISQVLVVEGYMDVIALAQNNIRYAVATLGTATTPEHLERLFRTAAKIVFCFDGDRAGRDAAWRALNTALPHLKDDREIRFLFLPDGHDPDSLVRKIGTDDFENEVSHATPLSQYLIDHMAANLDLKTPDGRARFVEKCRPQIQKVPNNLFRHLLIEQISHKIQVNPEKLTTLIFNKDSIRELESSVRKLPRKTGPLRMTPLRSALRMLIQNPKLAIAVKNPEQSSSEEGVQLLEQMVEFIQQHPHITTGGLIEQWRDSAYIELLARLASLEDIPEDALEQQFNDTLRSIYQQDKTQQLDELLRKSSEQQLTDSEKRLLKTLLAGQTEQSDQTHS